MKLIPLTQGQFAMVDDADFEELNKHKWYTFKDGRDHFVAARHGPRPKRETLYMHRVIMGTRPGQEVDHIDGNPLNNQRSNLRIVDRRGQMQGFRRKSLGCSSEFRGVSWNKNARKWLVKIMHDEHEHYLGLFTRENEKAAAEAFDAKARELGWPEYGLNFPQ